MVRAASSSSPSAKHITPEHPVKIDSIRPHATVAAGVSVFAWWDPLRGPGSAWDPDGASPDAERPPRNKTRPRHLRVRLFRFDIDRNVASTSGVRDLSLSRFGELQALVVRSQSTFVVAAAAEILARREHSERELRTKLRRKGFDRTACDLAVERLSARGYQSDERFADAWIRASMRGKGRSRQALAARLAEKGLDRTLAERAISRFERDHPGCFEEALARHVDAMAGSGEVPRSGRERDRLFQRLLRKGFSYGELKKFFA